MNAVSGGFFMILFLLLVVTASYLLSKLVLYLFIKDEKKGKTVKVLAFIFSFLFICFLIIGSLMFIFRGTRC